MLEKKSSKFFSDLIWNETKNPEAGYSSLSYKDAQLITDIIYKYYEEVYKDLEEQEKRLKMIDNITLTSGLLNTDSRTTMIHWIASKKKAVENGNKQG